ncbi:hypothetical protein RI367_000274 [Sorochytrium milnesiophthora]
MAPVLTFTFDPHTSRALKNKVCKRICPLALPPRRKRRSEAAPDTPWRKYSIMMGDSLCTGDRDIHRYFAKVGVSKQHVSRVFASTNGEYCVLVGTDASLSLLAVKGNKVFRMVEPFNRETPDASYVSDLQNIVVADDGAHALCLPRSSNALHIFTRGRVVDGLCGGQWERLDLSAIAAVTSADAAVHAAFSTSQCLVLHFVSQQRDGDTGEIGVVVCQASVSLVTKRIESQHAWYLPYSVHFARAQQHGRRLQRQDLVTHVRMRPTEKLTASEPSNAPSKGLEFNVSYNAEYATLAVAINASSSQRTLVALIYGTSPVARVARTGLMFARYSQTTVNANDTSLDTHGMHWWNDSSAGEALLLLINARGQIAVLSRMALSATFRQIRPEVAQTESSSQALNTVFTVPTLLATKDSIGLAFSVAAQCVGVGGVRSRGCFHMLCSDGKAITQIQFGFHPDTSLSLSPGSSGVPALNNVHARWEAIVTSPFRVGQETADLLVHKLVESLAKCETFGEVVTAFDYLAAPMRAADCDPRKYSMALVLAASVLELLLRQFEPIYSAHFVRYVEEQLLRYWEQAPCSSDSSGSVQWDIGRMILRDFYLTAQESDDDLLKYQLEVAVMRAPDQLRGQLPGSSLSGDDQMLAAAHLHYLSGDYSSAIDLYKKAIVENRCLAALPYLLVANIRCLRLLDAWCLFVGCVPATTPESRLLDAVHAYRVQHKPDFSLTAQLPQGSSPATQQLQQHWLAFAASTALSRERKWSQHIRLASAFPGESDTFMVADSVRDAAAEFEATLPLFGLELVLEACLLLGHYDQAVDLLRDLGDWINIVYLCLWLGEPYTLRLGSLLMDVMAAADATGNAKVVNTVMTIASWCSEVPGCQLNADKHAEVQKIHKRDSLADDLLLRQIISRRLDDLKHTITKLPLVVSEEPNRHGQSSILALMSRSDVPAGTSTATELLLVQVTTVVQLFGRPLVQCMRELTQRLPCTFALGHQAARMCRYLWFIELRGSILDSIEQSSGGDVIGHELTELVMLLLGFDDIVAPDALCDLALVVLRSYKKKVAISIVTQYAMYFSATMHNRVMKLLDAGSRHMAAQNSAAANAHIDVSMRDARFTAFAERCMEIWDRATEDRLHARLTDRQHIVHFFSTLVGDASSQQYATAANQTFLPLAPVHMIECQHAGVAEIAVLDEQPTPRATDAPKVEPEQQPSHAPAAQAYEAEPASKSSEEESEVEDATQELKSADFAVPEPIVQTEQLPLQPKDTTTVQPVVVSPHVLEQGPALDSTALKEHTRPSPDPLALGPSPLETLAQSLRDLALDTQKTISTLKESRKRTSHKPRPPSKRRSPVAPRRRYSQRAKQESPTRTHQAEYERFLHDLLQKQVRLERLSSF